MEIAIDLRFIGVALSNISTLRQLGNFNGNLKAFLKDLLYSSSKFKVSLKRWLGILIGEACV